MPIFVANKDYLLSCGPVYTINDEPTIISYSYTHPEPVTHTTLPSHHDIKRHRIQLSRTNATNASTDALENKDP